MTGLQGLRIAAAAVVTVLTVAAAQAPGFVAFSSVERGQWQLRESGGAARSVCVSDPAVFFQLRGRGGSCSRFVVENAPTSATVHYTCPGSGHGRTSIAVETPRLLRIDSQGIDAGAPFALEIEARRTGTC